MPDVILCEHAPMARPVSAWRGEYLQEMTCPSFPLRQATPLYACVRLMVAGEDYPFGATQYQLLRDGHDLVHNG